MAVIRRSLITLNESNFVQLYKALVRSHLDYVLYTGLVSNGVDLLK